ncbi:hypothetical protein Zmor_021008 [Zophobas morio]|uniref:Uncharacterized protein n=1 Tax=Zophobas morio TaxID=2755281 RepID=A0AA38I4M7_9CUCU|nr:hypothetical protein Zmor_021008 [Zophobas morio]
MKNDLPPLECLLGFIRTVDKETTNYPCVTDNPFGLLIQDSSSYRSIFSDAIASNSIINNHKFRDVCRLPMFKFDPFFSIREVSEVLQGHMGLLSAATRNIHNRCVSRSKRVSHQIERKV